MDTDGRGVVPEFLKVNARKGPWISRPWADLASIFLEQQDFSENTPTPGLT
jgi:hypothetical protein